jgi:Ni2+-binding GTPase involved in maturation of urease and hydrogenase
MTKTDTLTIDQVAAALDVELTTDQVAAAQFEIAAGTMRLTKTDTCIRWYFDGGCHGDASGKFTTITDVEDWRAANADAMIAEDGTLAMTAEEVDDLKSWLSVTVKDWSELTDSNRLAWTLEAIDEIENSLCVNQSGVCEVSARDSVFGVPTTHYVSR